MNFYTFLPKLLNMSLTGAVVILFVLLLRLFLKKAPKIISYALWAVVLFRLLCPISIESEISLFGLMDIPTTNTTTIASRIEYVPENIVHEEFPEVTLPIPGLSETINKTLPQGEEQLVADPLEAPVFIGTFIWMIGVLVMIAYSIVSYIRLRRKLLIVSPLRRNIYLADEITTPFVMGLFRPRIYLPSDTTENQLPHIILHEQHHIRRGDHIIKILAFGALSIHWFNPLVWVAFIYSNKDMEMSCDEAVINKMGNNILADYTASLLSLATGRTIIAGMPLAFGEGDTKGRIRNLANWKKPTLWVMLAAIIACVTLGIGLMTNPAKEDTTNHKEDNYYLLIGDEGVKSIEISGPHFGGGVQNADGSAYRVGDKVWLEQLQGVTNLRGMSIKALDTEGKIIYEFSVPEDATMETIANMAATDTWLLVPNTFELPSGNNAIDENKTMPVDEEIGMVAATISVDESRLEMAKDAVARRFAQMQDQGYINWRIDSLTEEYVYDPEGDNRMGDRRVTVFRLEYAFLAKDPEAITLTENMTMDEDGWVLPEQQGETYLCLVAETGVLSNMLFIAESDCVPGDDTFTEDLKELLGVGPDTAEDYYSMVTSASAKEVEQFAADIKENILTKDWKSLSDKIAYPIQMGETTINNSKEFTDLDIDGMLNQEFVNAINAESCREMFVNYQGIMMGETGQVWIASVDNRSGQWELKVIALNGMIDTN